MLSIDYIRNHTTEVKDAAKNKNREVDIDKILKLDDERRKLIKESQTLREERNIQSHKPPTEESKSRGRTIKEELKNIETRLSTIEAELNNLLLLVPNVPLPDVPIGPDAKHNVEIKTWGKPTQFSYQPKSHIELGKLHDLIDCERGVKVSGFRGYFLKNEAALLHTAVLFYTLRTLSEKGFTPLIAPAIVREFAFFGTGHFPWSREDVYQLNDKDAYLAGTAEVPVTAYYSGEILEERSLPKKFVALSPCFRKEAGAYGKDTKGIYRVHEFFKIEQVVIGKNDLKEAISIHEELQKNGEEILQDLEIPYRVVLMCTGDMGEPQMKKYDTEVWMPSRNGYGEVMSNSILGDFQARRLHIKYRQADNKTEHCFTYNNTAVASPRLLIAILENYQREDGSINIPKVLQPYIGKKNIALAK